MQVALGQLANHLQRGLKSLYPLPGDQPLLLQGALDPTPPCAQRAGPTARPAPTPGGGGLKGR